LQIGEKLARLRAANQQARQERRKKGRKKSEGKHVSGE
jgi:hypothetical protein